MTDLTPDQIIRRRSLEKWFVPEEFQRVSMPVDVEDEESFPLIAEACRELAAKRLGVPTPSGPAVPLGLRPEPVPVSAIRQVSHDAGEQ